VHEIDSKIKFFKDTHKPGTSFYIDENGDIRKGPMKFPRCMFCNIDLEKLRKNNSRRRFIKFCSANCRKEYNRRKKIREKLGASGVIWNPDKSLARNKMREIYVRNGKNPLEVPYKAKKSKWKFT